MGTFVLCGFFFQKQLFEEYHPSAKQFGSRSGGDVCRLLITFAYSLNPDHDRQNVGPDLDPDPLTL